MLALGYEILFEVHEEPDNIKLIIEIELSIFKFPLQLIFFLPAATLLSSFATLTTEEVHEIHLKSLAKT